MALLLDILKGIAVAAIGVGQLKTAEEWLRYFGYLKPDMTEAETQAAVRAFQSIFGLPADGMISHDDLAVMQLPRCGNHDVEMLTEGAAALCQWPASVPVVRYAITTTPAIMSKQAWRDCFAEATKRWSDVCGLKFAPVDDQSLANEVIFAGREDGPSGTLAWQELPCFGGGGVRVLQMKLDSQERWGAGIDPVAVVCHELGHCIGLSHIKPSAGVALLNPMYNPQITKPQPLDIEQAVLRYGPVAAPTPVPPPGGVDLAISVTLDGQNYAGTVRKVG